MARLVNKTFSGFPLRILLCLLVAAGLPLMTGLRNDPVSAQRPSRKLKSASQSQGKGSKSRPTPSPTPSLLDALGEPPPLPTPKDEPELNPGDVIKVETTEIMLPVTVRDANGRLVSELTRDDFRVFEDEREQPLSDLALRQVPVDVVLMVDASSSVATNLDDFRRAAADFAEHLAPEDRISLIKFDDRVELLQDWTQSHFQLRRALARVEPGMFTRFNDALLLAAREQFQTNNSRHAVIVLTDGIDSGRGTTTLAGALQALLRAGVTLYVVSNTEISRAAKRAELDALTGASDSALRFNQLRIDDLREGLRVLDQSEARLALLTTETGGRLYKPLAFDALDATYAEVADELRHQYGLYYRPLNKARDGGFRRVRVQIRNQTYQTHTRAGYYAPRS